MTDHIYFIGIGGVGMSAIAQVMHERGVKVSGSDRRQSRITDRLVSNGIPVNIGHNPDSIVDSSLVVYTAAVGDDNPELQAAKRLGIPVVGRAEMLGRLMKPYKKRVAITGTHGKTTTTSMVSLMLVEAGLDPTVLIGGDLAEFEGNVRIGKEPLFVTEACEAFESFLHLHPSIAVITDVDEDHMDYYKTFDRIKESFRQFVSQVDSDGCIIACVDDKAVRETVAGAPCRVVGYSTDGIADLCAVSLSIDSPKASYDLVRAGVNMGRIKLSVPGEKNAANSLAAAAVGFELGVSFDDIARGLAKFHGTGRRFEVLGTFNDIMIVDDYAHHPEEIKATLSAARQGWKRRIVAVFQPHLYSRTQIFAKEFAENLSAADVVIITDIYAARELPIEGVTAKLISDNMYGKNVRYIPDKSNVPDVLSAMIQPGDMVITMGAGDIRCVGEEVLETLSGIHAPNADDSVKL